ncbi:MAG: M15 family metallopeptidase [Acidimicrobiia bacterium]
MRRTLPALLPVLVLMAASLSLTAQAAESAIHPENRPTPLPEETNGRVRSGALMRVEGECRTARKAAPSLALMLAAARADGVGLLPDDCYRPRDDQASARSRNCARGNCACAARPGTSMHGWGKAVDFDDRAGTLRFSSTGYRWMKGNAARFGWNHPGWAEPGGSACPEAWHWEWVGDGGDMGLEPITADVVDLMASPGGGYWSVGGLGAVNATGDGAADHGSAADLPLVELVKGGAAHPSGKGYWLVASDGGVFSFGEAPFLGSLGDVVLNRPVVGMAAHPSGKGYWLVASDGGVFSFGEAPFHGSLGDRVQSRPVVGIASTPTGGGYWLATSDGAVSGFGEADDHGGLAAPPPLPVVAIEPVPGGEGYWLAAADGAVVAFGEAPSTGPG